MTARRSLSLLLVCLAALGIVACDSTPPPPKTYKVTGKVVFIEGGSPADGSISFQTPAISANGKIEADGTFTLTTPAGNKSVEGAVEGEHTVTYIPGPGPGNEQSNLLPSTAKEKYKVKADVDNNFTIRLARFFVHFLGASTMFV